MIPPPGTFIFNREGIRAVDRAMIEHHGLPGIVLMEQAGVGVARIVEEQFAPKNVFIACGRGNNGGDGYAMARLLMSRGISTTVLTIGRPKPGTDASVMAEVAARLQIPQTNDLQRLPEADLIVDALLGTGLDRPVSHEIADVILAINRTKVPVIAVDLPSGLDADAGRPWGHAVQARLTATLVGWKQGFLHRQADSYTGTIAVVDLGIPPEIARAHARVEPPGEL